MYNIHWQQKSTTKNKRKRKRKQITNRVRSINSEFPLRTNIEFSNGNVRVMYIYYTVL